MNEQLYLIEPAWSQFQEWNGLQGRIRKLASICQNRAVITQARLDEHRIEVENFVTNLQALNIRTLDLFKSVTLEEAKAAHVSDGSPEVAKILGIKFEEELPF